MILEKDDQLTRAIVRPELAERLAIRSAAGLSLDALRDRLARAKIAMHDPDFIFYLSTKATPFTDQDKVIRQIVEGDRTAFESFYQEASEQDRDDAFVEFDHWKVMGCFKGDRLVSAASMILWEGSTIADLGVLTLPEARGQGFARAVVKAINALTKQQGYEPQYRCQTDNRASVALAKSCGMHLFGKWTVASEAVGNGCLG